MDLREKILQAKDLKNKKITVPEWAVDVYIKAFTGADRVVFQEKISPLIEKKTMADSMAAMIHLLLIAIVDKDGKQIFTESDFESLNNKSNAVLERLTKEALSINGLDAKAESDAEKN